MLMLPSRSSRRSPAHCWGQSSFALAAEVEVAVEQIPAMTPVFGTLLRGYRLACQPPMTSVVPILTRSKNWEMLLTRSECSWARN